MSVTISGDTGISLVQPTALVAVQGAFRNLQASANGISASVGITCDEIVLKSASNGYAIARGVNVSINSAASGANGLDTGALAGATWYALWLISNGTTVAGLLSLSSSAPTLPSGYTYAARVGWVRTDGTANKYPLSFVQKGRKAQYAVVAGSNVANLPLMASGTGIGNAATPTWVAVAVGAFVPPTASEIAVIATNQTSNQLAVVPNNSFGGISSTTNPAPGVYFANGLFRMVLESANIYWANQGGTSYMTCLGWEDNL